MAKKVKSKQMATAKNAVLGFSLGYTNTGRFETTCSTSNPKIAIRQTGYHARHKQLTTTKCGCNHWQQMPDRSSMEYLIIKAGDHIAMDASKNSIAKTSTNTNCVTSNTAVDTRTVSSSSGATPSSSSGSISISTGSDDGSASSGDISMMIGDAPEDDDRCCFTKPYRKSLNSNISRLKTCNVTKDVKKSESASEKIQRIKAELLTCEKANPKPKVKSKCGGT
jgi:hypothetical protein